jgi:hypothetical protein
MRHSVKVVSAIVVLTVFIVGTSLVMQRVLARTSTDLVESITGVETGTTANDWKGAEKNLEQVRNKWSRISATWSMLIDHQEIDNIEVTLSRMEKFISARDAASALAETSALKNYVNHIPSRESLNLKNIL